MKRLKQILRQIRIEEYSFLFLILSLLVVYGLIRNSFETGGLVALFNTTMKNLVLGSRYFMLALLFFYIYSVYRLYLRLAEWLQKLVFESKGQGKKTYSLKKFKISILKAKETLLSFFPFFRLIVLMSVFFGIMFILLGTFASGLRGKLYDSLLIGLDRSILGSDPSLWPYSNIAILEKLAPLMVYTYSFLGLVMGACLVLFYLHSKRKYLSQFIIAIALACAIALPVWYLLPANSPCYFNVIHAPQLLTDKYDKQDSLLRLEPVRENQVDGAVEKFQESFNIKIGNIAPISTIPSMHMSWAMIIVFYLFRLNKRTIYIALPWAFFSTLGAVYLGQHYFVDFLASIPLTILSIWLANWLVRQEQKYYQKDRVEDKRELVFKGQVVADLKKIPDTVQAIFKEVRKKTR